MINFGKNMKSYHWTTLFLKWMIWAGVHFPVAHK